MSCGGFSIYALIGKTHTPASRQRQKDDTDGTGQALSERGFRAAFFIRRKAGEV